MSINFPWDLLQSTSVPEILIFAGFALCIPGLGIEIQGVRFSERFRPTRALAIGATVGLLGVAMEILVHYQTNTEGPSERSEAVADRVTIEERTALPVTKDEREADMESEVKTTLEESSEKRLHRFIEVWTAIPAEDSVRNEMIKEIREHLPGPEVKLDSQTRFGGRTIVTGHATVHVSLDALNKGRDKAFREYIRRGLPRDVPATVPAESIGTHGQSDVQTKLPLGE